MSPISPQVYGKIADNQDDPSEMSGLHKKASSLPISEIEKVKELLDSHHRPHESPLYQLSYKLKIVFIMMIIGIAFLIVDTLRDRKSKKSMQVHIKKGHKHDNHE